MSSAVDWDQSTADDIFVEEWDVDS
jgi:hypothetical protein